MTSVARVLYSAALVAATATPAVALDYEAKPIMWCLQAPFRLTGALCGAAVSGGVSGPIDKGYHGFEKGTKRVAGKLGDENGTGQMAAAAPVGGSTGLILGSAYGVHHGFWHGFKKGWQKPFSRWSYITMEEQ